MSAMMNKGETPCYGCGDRFVGCHSQCEKYKVFREESLRRYKKAHMDWQIEDTNWKGKGQSKKEKFKDPRKARRLMYNGRQ